MKLVACPPVLSGLKTNVDKIIPSGACLTTGGNISSTAFSSNTQAASQLEPAAFRLGDIKVIFTFVCHKRHGTPHDGFLPGLATPFFPGPYGFIADRRTQNLRSQNQEIAEPHPRKRRMRGISFQGSLSIISMGCSMFGWFS